MNDNVIDRRARKPWYRDQTILFIIVQTLGLFAYAVRMDVRLEDHERRIVKGELLDDRYVGSNNDLCQRMARVEEKTGALLDSTRRIEELVRDHMNNGGRK